MNFADMRENMVDCQIRPEHVLSMEILDVFLDLPREKFTPRQLQHIAYMDEDFPLENGRVMFRPCDLAGMVQAANLSKQDTVLYVGANTGYGPCLLSPLCQHITAIEQDKPLAQQAEKTTEELGLGNIDVLCSPFSELPQTPVDVVIIEGKVEIGLENLLDRLKEGGRLVTVCPCDKLADEVTVFTKIGQNISQRSLFTKNTAALPGFEKQPQFKL